MLNAAPIHEVSLSPKSGGHIYHISPGERIATRCLGLRHLAEMAVKWPEFTLYLERIDTGSYATGGAGGYDESILDARKFIRVCCHEAGTIRMVHQVSGRPSPMIRWYSDRYHLAITYTVELHSDRSSQQVAKRLVDRATHSVEFAGQDVKPRIEVRRQTASRYRVRV
jgi:hypothetical protein